MVAGALLKYHGIARLQFKHFAMSKFCCISNTEKETWLLVHCSRIMESQLFKFKYFAITTKVLPTSPAADPSASPLRGADGDASRHGPWALEDRAFVPDTVRGTDLPFGGLRAAVR